MVKRLAATGLWFLSVWFAYELVWSLTGVPRMIGPVLAASAAAFVGLDPLQLVWPVRQPSRRATSELAALSSSAKA